MKLFLGFDRYTDTEERELCDEGDRHSTVTTVIYSDKFYTRYETITNNSYESVVVDDELSSKTTLYFVVANYSTGDSFGTDTGYCVEIMDVLEDSASAEKLAIELSAYSEGWYVLSSTGKKYYIPWRGYFESLCSVDVVVATRGFIN